MSGGEDISRWFVFQAGLNALPRFCLLFYVNVSSASMERGVFMELLTQTQPEELL